MSKRFRSTSARDRLVRVERERRHSHHLPRPLLEDLQPLTRTDPWKNRKRRGRRGGRDIVSLCPSEFLGTLQTAFLLRGNGETLDSPSHALRRAFKRVFSQWIAPANFQPNFYFPREKSLVAGFDCRRE